MGAETVFNISMEIIRQPCCCVIMKHLELIAKFNNCVGLCWLSLFWQLENISGRLYKKLFLGKGKILRS
jgi:hypothetical protein